MNVIRTSDPRPKSEVDLYYEACEALDSARLTSPNDRELIARLTYKMGVARDNAHAALEARDRSATENIKSMFRELRGMNNALASCYEHGHYLTERL